MPAMAEMTLWVRDNPITSAENSANDVKTTFSSWDNCMSKAYCKWPVIVAIIIASLILLSIISCLVRCLCCGLECCCGCFRCFNTCCECCTPSRNRRDRYREADSPPFGSHNPYGGYQPPPAAPTYIIQQSAPPQPQRYEPSRNYATYETESKRAAPSTVHEDSLAPMPTWQDAQNSHVEHYEEEDVEMDHLNYHPPNQQASMLHHQAPSPLSRNQPTSSAQTEGMGLYNDTPTHHAEGDLGDAYGHGVVPAAAGMGAAAMHPAYRDEYSGYQSPQGHAAGYASPPAHDPYNPPQGTASSYYQPTTSPAPPSYHSETPDRSNYGVVSPVSTGTSGLPSALTPGGGIQPAHQAHGQDNGTTGGHSYAAYH